MYIATNKYHYFYSEAYHLSVKLLSSVIKENIVLENLYCNNNPVQNDHMTITAHIITVVPLHMT